jgi:hypothetical protein
LTGRLLAARLARLRPHVAYLILAGYTLLAHGLLLLNDGLYVDGWLYDAYIREGRWELLTALAGQQGQPQTAALYFLLGQLPNPILAHRLLALSAIYLSGCFIYATGRATGCLSRPESLLLAQLSIAYPGYQYAVEISHIWNLLPYCLFLGGWWLVWRGGRAAGGGRAIRPAAAALFLLSFTHPGLLLYFYGLYGLWLLRPGPGQQPLPGRRLLAQLGRRPELPLLPPLYWLAMRLLVPPGGVFADYNQLSGRLLASAASWQAFVETAVFGQLGRLFDLLPAWLIVAVVGLVLALGRAYHLERRPFFRAGTSPAGLFAFGLLLLALGMAPYIAVGKLPELYGFESRVTLLVGLPLAILLLGLLRLLLAAGRSGRGLTLPRAGFMVVGLLLIGFALAQMESYLAWQARWVRDLAILGRLPALTGAREYALLYVTDDYRLRLRDGRVDPISEALDLRFFQEWVVMFRRAYGPDVGLVGFDDVYLEPTAHYYRWVNELRRQTLETDLFFLAGYDPAGDQGRLVVEPTAAAEQMGKLGLARRYWQYKLLQPGRLRPFLDSLVRLRLEPLAE